MKYQSGFHLKATPGSKWGSMAIAICATLALRNRKHSYTRMGGAKRKAPMASLPSFAHSPLIANKCLLQLLSLLP